MNSFIFLLMQKTRSTKKQTAHERRYKQFDCLIRNEFENLQIENFCNVLLQFQGRFFVENQFFFFKYK